MQIIKTFLAGLTVILLSCVAGAILIGLILGAAWIIWFLGEHPLLILIPAIPAAILIIYCLGKIFTHENTSEEDEYNDYLSKQPDE